MITPEEFAAGSRQILNKKPEKPEKPAPDLQRWLQHIDTAYPPRSESIPLRQPPQNDPFVSSFLTDVLGRMVSFTTANRLYQREVSGAYSDEHIAKAAYGRRVCVWVAEDKAWNLLFKNDTITLRCDKRPNHADMEKLIFVIGWWKLRTESYNRQDAWRNLILTNVGAIGGWTK